MGNETKQKQKESTLHKTNFILARLLDLEIDHLRMFSSRGKIQKLNSILFLGIIELWYSKG